MKLSFKYFFILTVISMIHSQNLHAKTCPDKYGTYGNGLQYQDIACTVMIDSEKSSDGINYRKTTFTDEGMIQFFSNFKGTTNSNSTGARVYYLFPLRDEKKITAIDDDHFAITNASGVHFNFDKKGMFSAPELQMKVSAAVNSQNKGGVEIASYSNGIVIDIGYRMGSSPTTNMAAPVVITDKNKKKCSLVNSDIHRKVGKYDVELIYKTNGALHKFLSSKCPGLDLSDLASPMTSKIKAVTANNKKADAAKLQENDSSRKSKQSFEESMEEVIKSLPTTTPK